MKTNNPVKTNTFARSAYRSLILPLLVTIIAFCAIQTRADTIALSFTGGTALTEGVGPTATLGYAFTLSSAVTVTQLGLFDAGNIFGSNTTGDGLLLDHTVTIWTSTGTQEAQAIIPAGTGATLINGFRYVSIPSVFLPAGSYTIGASFTNSASDDRWMARTSTITTASGVTYNGSRSGSGFAFPTGDIVGELNGDFGPNFQFTTSVPDAGSTFGLLALALAGLVGASRLRHFRLA